VPQVLGKSEDCVCSLSTDAIRSASDITSRKSSFPIRVFPVPSNASYVGQESDGGVCVHVYVWWCDVCGVLCVVCGVWCVVCGGGFKRGFKIILVMCGPAVYMCVCMRCVCVRCVVCGCWWV